MTVNRNASTSKSNDKSSSMSEMKNEDDDLPLAKRSREQQHQPTSISSLESYALKEIPLGVAHYEVSWMHRSIVTRMAYSEAHGYILTCSNDGVCKFWKRLVAASKCLEFVKSYQAHKASILSLCVDASHNTAATVGLDNTIQIYDISSFDISSTIFCTNQEVKLGEHAAFCCSKETLLLATSSREINKGDIYIWHVLLGTLFQTLTFHASPITSIQYNIRYNCALSTDLKGIIEIWDCTLVTDDNNNNDTLRIGSNPSLQANGIQWTSKMSTSLYEFAKHKVVPISSCFSSNGNYMAIYGNDDKIRLFSCRTGCIIRIYDESAQMYATTLTASVDVTNQQQQQQENVYDMDMLEYGKRAATEREMAETTIYTGGVSTPSSSASLQLINMTFDSSSTFLLYPSLMGIKVVSILNHTCCRIIGKGDASSLRFLTFCLCSGDAKVNAQMELMRSGGSSTAMSTNHNDEEEDRNKDPMLICAAFQKKRIYVFSNRDPLDIAAAEEDTTAISQVQINRNIINEPPDADDLWSANAAVAIMMANSSSSQKNKLLGTEAVLRTTMGDIHIRLFGEQCPRTVENFCSHARNGYYDNVIFHRVIKGFMIQTGDPLGDGTGGESIWGGEFEDEFNRELRHDRPFTVSMANAGPNTNGSQFFITTVPTPWLDNKHTVFGRLIKGMDIATSIEAVTVDDTDKPLTDVFILSVDIS